MDAIAPRYDPYAMAANRARLAGFDAPTRARIDTLTQAVLADTAQDKPRLCRAFYGLFLRNFFADTAAQRRTAVTECADTADNLARDARVGRNTSQDWGAWVWDTAMKRVDAPVLIDRASHYSFVDRPDVFFPAVERFLNGE